MHAIKAVTKFAGITLAFTLAMLTGCTSTPAEKHSDDTKIIVSVADSALTLQDVRAAIPSGLNEYDSIAMARNIVDRWLRDMLLQSVANENIIDMQHIDQMTEEFRNRLIISEYIKRMQNSKNTSVSESNIKAYYDANAPQMRLERPLIKGLLLKISIDTDASQLRRWMKNASAKSIDNIEKYGLSGAMQYDYFMDRWVDWQDISASIPYRFGSADNFVSKTTDFETTVGDARYLLHISERKLSGEIMPYDFAQEQIRQALEQRSRHEYADALMTDLCNRAQKQGILKMPGYNPKTHEIITNNDK